MRVVKSKTQTPQHLSNNPKKVKLKQTNPTNPTPLKQSIQNNKIMPTFFKAFYKCLRSGDQRSHFSNVFF